MGSFIFPAFSPFRSHSKNYVHYTVVMLTVSKLEARNLVNLDLNVVHQAVLALTILSRPCIDLWKE